MHASWSRNRTPTKSLANKIPIEVWEGKKLKMNKSHNFGCLVQYLKVGAEKSKQGDKFAHRTCFGVFLGMAAGSAGYNVFDPHRAGVIARTDVRFFEEVPGYPKLMGGRAPQVEATAEKHFFYLFPDTEDEPPATLVPASAIPPNMPAVVPPMPAPAAPAAPVPAAANNLQHDDFQPQAVEVPIIAIELSDNQFGINNARGGDAGEEEVQGGGANPRVGEPGSIAERVMARRRANFAQYGDIL